MRSTPVQGNFMNHTTESTPPAAAELTWLREGKVHPGASVGRTIVQQPLSQPLDHLLPISVQRAEHTSCRSHVAQRESKVHPGAAVGRQESHVTIHSLGSQPC